jgi:hypothetical protein
MEPTNINDPKFPVDKLIYNDEEFSIIWGSFDKGPKCLGMRWNFYPREPGFPSGAGGRPLWLVIPVDLTIPFLTGLLGKRDNPTALNLSAALEVLSEVLKPSQEEETIRTAT